MNFYKWRVNNQETVEIVRGEARTFIFRLMDESYNPITLTDATAITIQMNREDGIGIISRSMTALSFVSADIDVTTSQITIEDHGLATNDKFRLTTAGTLPDPLALLTDYYAIVIDADTIQLAASEDGEAITLVDDGTGTFTTNFTPLALTSGVLGKVTMELSAAASAALVVGEKQTVELEYTILGVKRIAQLTKVLTVLDQAG